MYMVILSTLIVANYKRSSCYQLLLSACVSVYICRRSAECKSEPNKRPRGSETEVWAALVTTISIFVLFSFFFFSFSLPLRNP